MGPRERHRIIIIIIAFCRCTREEEKHSRGEKKRERERGIKRERKLFVPFLCVRVYLCACASSGVFVSLNIALCAVLCAHATRSALRSEEKTLSLLEKEKEDFVSISHFVSLYKNRGKHEKKHVKKGKREKSLLFWWFFLLSFPLSRNLSFFAPTTLVVKINL